MRAARSSLPGRPQGRSRRYRCGPSRMRLDQVGYPVSGGRFAVVVSPGRPAPRYRIVDAATGRDVAGGSAGPRVLDATSRAGTPLTGDRIDLSKLGIGSYFVVLDDGS